MNVKKFFIDMWTEFQKASFYIIVSKILTDVNSRFIFIFLLLYATFTISQSFTPSKLPFQTNMLVGISLFVFLQILFSRISSDFEIYESMFATFMIVAVTTFLGLLFTIGNKWDESMQITSITTCFTFILAYYVARYYPIFKNGTIESGNKSSTSDSLFKALLCSFAIGIFVLGLTREYNEPDPSYNPDVDNDYSRTSKNPNGTDKLDSKGNPIYVVPVYIYRWNNTDGGRRFVGEVTKYGKKGIEVTYLDSNNKEQRPFISWRELREKGSSLLIHRGKNADGTDDLGTCGTYSKLKL